MYKDSKGETMKFIICLLFGHKRYRPKVFNNHSFITIRDSIGEDLYHINMREMRFCI